MHRDSRSAFRAEVSPRVGTSICVGVAKRENSAGALALSPLCDVHGAVSIDREMPSGTCIVGKECGAEAFGYYETGIAGAAACISARHCDGDRGECARPSIGIIERARISVAAR